MSGCPRLDQRFKIIVNGYDQASVAIDSAAMAVGPEDRLRGPDMAMTSTSAAGSRSRRPERRGLRRGSPSPELIVKESVGLLGGGGAPGVRPAQAGPCQRRGPDRGLPALRQQG